MATEKLKVIMLPRRDEMLRRLISAFDESHAIRNFYPLLLEHAGQEITGTGIVLMLTLAAADYTRTMPSVVTQALYTRMSAFVNALVDDDEVRNEALQGLRAANIA